MIRTVDAIYDEHGRVVLPSGIDFDDQRHRALVIIFDEAPPSAPPTVTTVEPDLQVSQRYHLLDRIGAGGMGEVFRVFDQQTKTIACLKRLHQGVRAAALRQELLALRRLHHPNIIALLDQSVDSPIPYLVTEFVDGPNLASWLEVHKPIPELLAADIMQQIFDGLAFAHRHEIIHCDLKPGNIMIELEGVRLKPRILDFGLAVVDRVDDDGRLTAAGRVAGTLEYMAPEQFQAELLTPACDVYAAGLMLATLITGANAYRGLDFQAMVTEKLIARNGLRLEVPVHGLIADLVERCTQPTPASRPTASEVAAALRSLTAELHHPMRPINLEFTRGLMGWENGIGKVAGVSPQFLARVIADAGGAPVGVALESLTGLADQFGVLVQSFPAERLIGERLRLQANVTTHRVTGRAALWCRVDSEDNSLAFDNMLDRPISGTTDSRPVSLEITVPEGARTIHIGLLLSGCGAMTARQLRLLLVAGDAKTDLSLLSAHYAPA